MATYRLAVSDGEWILTKAGDSGVVGRYTDKQQALRESLHIAHEAGASLVLTPKGPKIRRTDGSEN